MVSEMNVRAIQALISDIKNSKMIESQFTMHHNVVGQELWKYCYFILKISFNFWYNVVNCAIKIENSNYLNLLQNISDTAA